MASLKKLVLWQPNLCSLFTHDLIFLFYYRVGGKDNIDESYQSYLGIV